MNKTVAWEGNLQGVWHTFQAATAFLPNSSLGPEYGPYMPGARRGSWVYIISAAVCIFRRVG